MLMKNAYILMSLLITLGIGVLIGKSLYDKPVKVLSVTVYADGYPNRIKDINNITDRRQIGEEMIDDLILLLIQADSYEEISLPEDKPDYSFRLYSRQSGYTLKKGDIWFLDDGTSLIANPTVNDQSLTGASYLNKEETKLLKKLVKNF